MGCQAPNSVLYAAVLIVAALHLPGIYAIHLHVKDQTPAIGNGTNASSPSGSVVNISAQHHEPSAKDKRTNGPSSAAYSMNMSQLPPNIDELFKDHGDTCSDLEDAGLDIVSFGDVQPDTTNSTSLSDLAPTEVANVTHDPADNEDSHSANDSNPRKSSHRQRNNIRMRRTKPMIWMHIHKAAGGMMCTLAKMNKEVIVEFGNSACMWLNQDFWFPIPGLWGYPGTPSCDDRLHFLEYEIGRGTDGHNVTWLQIERPFRAQDFCPQSFRYGIMLREPFNLAVSMTNFRTDWEPYQGDQYKNIIRCLNTSSYRPGDDLHLCEQSQNLYGLKLWMFYDNFVVRLLDGLDTYRLSPGGVTGKHAHRVINILNKFDVVTILEHIDEDYTFQKHFGWKYTVAPHVNFNKNDDKTKKISFDSDETAFIKNRIKYDYAVYRYFERSYRAKTQIPRMPNKKLIARHAFDRLTCKAAISKANENRGQPRLIGN